MSQTWMEDLESEDYESNGEADYEEPGADARSDARRARQQRIMLERQRMMLDRQRREAEPRRRRPPSLPRGAMPPPSELRSPDLETRMELHSLRRQVMESNRRASRGTWAAVAGVAAAEIINQFDALGNHPNVSAAIIGAPLLLLSPEKQRSGIEGFLLDPRVIGGAAVVGIVVASKWGKAHNGIFRLEMAGQERVKAGNTGSVTGLPFDRNNNYLSEAQANVTYAAVPSGILNIDPSNGNYTATGKGDVVVIARCGEVSTTTTVTVH
jgi:hypothetical protein